jgi:hypothetical protein
MFLVSPCSPSPVRRPLCPSQAAKKPAGVGVSGNEGKRKENGGGALHGHGGLLVAALSPRGLVWFGEAGATHGALVVASPSQTHQLQLPVWTYLGSGSDSQFLFHMLLSFMVCVMTFLSTVSISFLSWSVVHEEKARST